METKMETKTKTHPFASCGEWYVICKKVDSSVAESDTRRLKVGLNKNEQGIFFISKLQLPNYEMHKDIDDMYAARITIQPGSRGGFVINDCMMACTELIVDEPQRIDQTFIDQHIAGAEMDFNFNAGRELTSEEWTRMTCYHYEIEV